jgi:hypothetical protein
VGQLNDLEKEFMEGIQGNPDLSEEEKGKIVTGINICYNLHEIKNIEFMREQMLKESAFA